MKIMPSASKSNFDSHSFICLQTQSWLENQRVAGKIAAKALQLLEREVKNKTKFSLIELNDLAEQFILQSGGELTFKGYKGFPAGICCSANQQLVHGIPTDYKLQEGDLVSFDLGVTYKGSIADTAITCIYGKSKSEQHELLVKVTEEALLKGIEAIRIGKKLGCIGAAIHKHIKTNGFGTIEKLGGHFLNISEDGVGIPHAPPFISNKSNSNEGITIQPGMAMAIEPMAIIGDTHTFVADDGWTVIGQGISSHVEHSIFIHNDRIEIVSWRDDCVYPCEILF